MFGVIVQNIEIFNFGHFLDYFLFCLPNLLKSIIKSFCHLLHEYISKPERTRVLRIRIQNSFNLGLFFSNYYNYYEL